MPAQYLLFDGAAKRRLMLGVGVEQRMDMAVSKCGLLRDADRIGVRDRTAKRLVNRSENLGKHGIEPVDEELPRAKIPAQQ